MYATSSTLLGPETTLLFECMYMPTPHSPMNSTVTVWAKEHVEFGGTLLVGGGTPGIQTQL